VAQAWIVGGNELLRSLVVALARRCTRKMNDRLSRRRLANSSRATSPAASGTQRWLPQMDWLALLRTQRHLKSSSLRGRDNAQLHLIDNRQSRVSTKRV